MKLKYPLCSFFFISSFLVLIIYSGASFYQSLYRNVSEIHLLNLNDERDNLHTFELTEVLQSKVNQFIFPLSHDLVVSAKLLGWMSHSTQSYSNVKEIEEVINLSVSLRPTWSPAYTQLFHLYWRVGNEDEANEMLRLANMFGPNRIETILTSVDYTFTNWLFASLDDRLRASKQLLTISESWKHRSELNQMITYSPGKQRICNMLAFNKVKVSACL